MPPQSLRKACQACSSGKRRCHPQLPRCPRCERLDITCVYDIEPLSSSRPAQKPEINEKTVHNLKIHDPDSSSPYYLFDSLASAHRAATQMLGVSLDHSSRPEIRFLFASSMMERAKSWLGQIPSLKASGQSSPFVHAQLYNSKPEYVQRIQAALSLQARLSATDSELKELSPSRNPSFQRAVTDVLIARPMTDMLLSLDEIILYLIIYFLSGRSTIYATELEPYIELLPTRNTQLWSVLPNQLDAHLSPWQAWLTAESARRSLIASRMIRTILRAAKSNYVIYDDFIEAQPFDPRPGLWEATSEEAWQLAKKRHGDHSDTVLVSFHEYVEYFDIRPDWHGEGLFQKMLLMAKSDPHFSP